MDNSTICAVSTAVGTCAISIVRCSGVDAIKIVNSIFKGKDLEKVDSHTISYGHIVFDGEDITVKDTWTGYVSDGNAILAEPEDYMTLR